VVGGGPAMATWHGGETPTRAARGMTAYRALLASNVGVVRWWDHDGVAAVVEERRGAS